MNNRLTQLIRYSGTAGAAAIVDIGLFGVLDAISIPLVIAAALSFLVATVANYVLTARFVFRHKFSLGGYLRFLSAASVGFVLNVGTTMIAAQTFELPVLLAKTVGVGVDGLDHL